jgi:putative CocE/NonD family hydrolase
MSVKVDVSRDVMIPMRDGVNLSANIYRPRGGASKLPTILTRSPYGKENPILAAMGEYKRLAASGYVVVVQDKRGLHKSEGEYSFLRDDSAGKHQDGYDTVEWIAEQDWSDGRVIAFGTSYPGHTTMGVAVANPPHLTAAMSAQPANNEYTNRTFIDGALSVNDVVGWATNPIVGPMLIATKPEAERAKIKSELALFKGDKSALYRTLPLESFPFMRHFPKLWADPLQHRDDPEFFAENRIAEDEAARIEVPIVHVGGWFDFFTRNSVRQFELANELSSAEQLLVMGPWTHGGFVSGKVSGVKLPDGSVDTNQLLLEWAGSRSRDGARGKSKVAAYLYVLGANKWRAEPAWPIPGTKVTPYFLRADNKLAAEAGPDGVRQFDYDPRDPYTAKTVLAGLPDVGAQHKHPGVLVYQSDVLGKPVEITGWPSVELHARTSATDVDWVVELNVVGVDGTSRLHSEGIARARYRHGRDQPEAVVPGEERTYRVEMRPISVQVKAGERIEIAITGGKFPTYERNPGSFIDLNTFTEDDMVVSHNDILSGVTGSKVFLPIVPEGAQGTWVKNPWPGTRKWRLTMGMTMRAIMSLQK